MALIGGTYSTVRDGKPAKPSADKDSSELKEMSLRRETKIDATWTGGGSSDGRVGGRLCRFVNASRCDLERLLPATIAFTELAKPLLGRGIL